jgi:uncharacterized protein (TIGR03437 family)
LELNPAGSAATVALIGFGGYAIALDAQGNIYAAGGFMSTLAPTSPGAFQATAKLASCFSSFIMVDFCANQHIAKIDPTGTKLFYATYLSGAFGALPSGIAVDAAGNAIVAGSTNSPDYPTTPGAYQPDYFPNPETAFFPPHEFGAPASAGYVTKLNATGTGLIWSTLIGGSSAQLTLPGPVGYGIPAGDNVTSMAIDGNGNILLSGVATSPDFPGLWSTYVTERPSGATGFVTRLSPDGTTLSSTQLLTLAYQSISQSSIAVRADGSAVVAPTLANVTVSPVGRVAAICDTADNAKIVRVVPGQLLTLYGTNLAPASVNGDFGVVVSVTFNGILAPILYTSGIQINLQVPYEIAGLSEVTMQVSSTQVVPAISESYILGVAARQPSVFISSSGYSQPLFNVASCNGQNVSAVQPLALNADGTLNSCANPAPSGSVVTIFLNGLGVSSPQQTTGALSTSAVAISPAAGLASGSGLATKFLSTMTLPGSIDAIAQAQIQVSSSTSSFLTIPLDVADQAAGYWVRGPGIVIWVAPAR